MDLISASVDDNKVAWYPNVYNASRGQFSPSFVFGNEVVISRTTLSAYKVEIAGIGRASLLDLLSSAHTIR